MLKITGHFSANPIDVRQLSTYMWHSQPEIMLFGGCFGTSHWAYHGCPTVGLPVPWLFPHKLPSELSWWGAKYFNILAAWHHLQPSDEFCGFLLQSFILQYLGKYGWIDRERCSLLYSEVMPPLHLRADPLFVHLKNTLASFGAAALMSCGFPMVAPNPFKGATFQDAVCLFLCCGQGHTPCYYTGHF